MSRTEETPEVVVDGIAAGGAGVGRLPDGRAVFVHRTAPGERVRIRVTEEKKRWARGRLLEVLEAAPERREAPCPHYDRCGGCTLEHLAYPAQLRSKAQIVADAMERIGGVTVDPPEVRPSPQEVRYRSRVTFTLRRLGNGRVVAGFHELERPGRIVDLGAECLLPREDVAQAWDRLRAAWGPRAGRLPSGDRLRLTLRSVSQGVMLVVEGGRDDGDADALLERVPELVAIWRRPEGGEERLLAGRSDTTERFGGEEVTVRGSAFLQVNRRAGEAVQRYVLERIGPRPGLRVVDAYCGLAILGRRLAREGVRVTGIEHDPRAVRGARSDAPEGLEIVEGDVSERLGACLPADRVVLNPPRTGLDARIPGILADAPPPRIVYVSCDPATLARDADRLSDRFRLASLRSFDLFPQTDHVETVAVFDREED